VNYFFLVFYSKQTVRYRVYDIVQFWECLSAHEPIFILVSGFDLSQLTI